MSSGVWRPAEEPCLHIVLICAASVDGESRAGGGVGGVRDMVKGSRAQHMGIGLFIFTPAHVRTATDTLMHAHPQSHQQLLKWAHDIHPSPPSAKLSMPELLKGKASY